VKLYTLYSDPTKKRRTSYLIEDTRGNFTTATALSRESLISDIIYLNDTGSNYNKSPMTAYSPDCKELASFDTIDELYVNYPELFL
jgi:hypothetical protein